ncbi:MAG: FKBP-type peptidyl-prolyl cis-trans isomerase [Tannerella sp.]|jgi:FKBP-type peptidyl-prolyl cis-trans isomerase FkpA/FKBP-type peptidyl-prolyl cis-trans isomerase FklB|nr:FKBP-type peptidyl-prolyl cis-trans isomerase [Tannerella sp.]
MKKFSFLAITAVVMTGIAFSSCDSKKSVSLKSGLDSVSYIIGASYGNGLKENIKTFPGSPGNVDALVAGFVNAAEGDTIHLGMDMQAAQAYVQEYFQNAQTRLAEETKAEGDKFLEENKTKSGVITTLSGLQYKVITEGTGIKPAAEDTVKVHYTGKLLDGTKFDSSVDRGEPATFPLNGVIRGWSEGVQLMPVGSKYIFWVPADLAYGTQSPSQLIKPNSTLEFEVELLEVTKAK